MINTYTLFISDLHLQAQEPSITATFFDFLENKTHNIDALYILGDLFEMWIGDDDTSTFNKQVSRAIKKATSSGLPIYFMHGNRDFLLGNQFIKESGMRLLVDPTLINLYGKPTLLMHGDSLCTLDKAYQLWRRQAVKPFNQWMILRLPLSWRRKAAHWLRRKSRQHQSHLAQLDKKIMDVNPETVLDMMHQHGVQQLIHGHTHRPAIHLLMTIDEQPAKRIVLGSWHHCGNMLKYNAAGDCELIAWSNDVKLS